ncbi:hypothetical protein FOMPIDRAFT_1021568 [Fomitopsis schrenkii]|uniref:Uncharacterized protein n=1 Tax=Fomitopsis schrenkii TaxID=2126942 RepID=S8FW15_FOMSC|nr:hypothetical protein FOMPIDRAFT_1021568 [Fomitopsis schrenkii]
MATYYARPRHSAPSTQVAHAAPAQVENEAYNDQLPSLDIDIGEQSIYIFPNPSSVPPSPGSSSLFSAPTDSPSSLDSSARHLDHRQSRGRNPTSSFSAPTTTTSRSGSASSYLLVRRSLSPPTPTDTDLDAYVDGDIEVELWDWTGSSARSRGGRGGSSEPESWVLEEEVQRASRWALADADTHTRGRPFPLGASSVHARVALDDARRRLSLGPLRTRTNSRSSGSLGSGSAPAPQPRIRIPLLSFFAALLSLDLDDPALRLLTQAAPPDGQSILFPGHSGSSLSASSESASHFSEEKPARRLELVPDLSSGAHGLQRLLSSTTEPAGAALRSLRAGLSIPLEIDVPGVTGLASLFRAVGEAYHRSGQAWRDVWAGA